jgi:catechol 2,3-dioxygenase-like lactoylglutathione lyase family enzyme
MNVRDLYFVELVVADWPKALAWYQEVLGLEILVRVEADQFALCRAGQTRLALKGGEPLPGTVLLTFEVADLSQAVRELAARDIALDSPLQTSAEGYRDVLLRDPDGYRICLFDWAVAP